ncbi:HEAT repeat domain-containing protein [Phenylobacterium hankyongense]|uniref:HEAT repeat domain-containing protein n=1 Tax=Phenylobacterium hankyongense TaxID=1813876 RepID=A0A328B1E8_9CAUL|nr:HEAT repeat domain-containing protein [Phenylobacterium hankyongense]RAK60993.1 HEAT repeat domain-containing protein [Phenylobacterium hankyongense]
MPLIRRTSQSPEPGQDGASPSDLCSASAEARWAAARRLAAPEWVPALGEALAIEQDPRAREAILTSLARVASPEAARLVAGCIRSDDATIRTGALDALRAMPEAAAAVLPALLADTDPDVRLLACEVVREQPAAEAAQLLTALLAQEVEPNVCAAALDVLVQVGGPEILPALDDCARRFAGEPFLAFAIKVARERLGEKPGGSVA